MLSPSYTFPSLDPQSDIFRSPALASHQDDRLGKILMPQHPPECCSRYIHDFHQVTLPQKSFHCFSSVLGVSPCLNIYKGGRCNSYIGLKKLVTTYQIKRKNFIQDGPMRDGYLCRVEPADKCWSSSPDWPLYPPAVFLSQPLLQPCRCPKNICPLCISNCRLMTHSAPQPDSQFPRVIVNLPPL